MSGTKLDKAEVARHLKQLEIEEEKEIESSLAGVPPIFLALAWCSAVEVAAWDPVRLVCAVAALYAILVAALYLAVQNLPRMLFDKFSQSATYTLSFLCSAGMQALVVLKVGSGSVVLGNLVMIAAWILVATIWHYCYLWLHERHSGHELAVQKVEQMHTGLISCTIAGLLEGTVCSLVFGYATWIALDSGTAGSTGTAMEFATMFLASVVCADVAIRGGDQLELPENSMARQVLNSTFGYYLGFMLQEMCKGFLAGPLSFLNTVAIGSTSSRLAHSGDQESELTLGILLFPFIIMLVGGTTLVVLRDNGISCQGSRGKVGVLMYQACLALAFEALADAFLDTVDYAKRVSSYFWKALALTILWAGICSWRYFSTAVKEDADEEKPILAASKTAASYQKSTQEAD